MCHTAAVPGLGHGSGASREGTGAARGDLELSSLLVSHGLFGRVFSKCHISVELSEERDCGACGGEKRLPGTPRAPRTPPLGQNV